MMFPYRDRCASAVAILLGFGVSVSGCATEGRLGGGGVGPCAVAAAPAECQLECGASGEACPVGFYCGASGTCTADCTAAAGCGATQRCSAEGRCVAVNTSDAAGGDGSVCANVMLDTNMVVPSVILIVDRSGSMGDNELMPGAGVTRWDALQDALVGANGIAGADGMGPGATGLVFEFQDKVRFGLALYAGTDAQCPAIVTQPTPLRIIDTNGYPAIKVAYDQAVPEDFTPTHLAMKQVLDDLLGLADPLPAPVLFILATDGEPNECTSDTTDVARPQVIAQTQRAYANGIRTYVISLAGDDPDLQSHLDEVANVGQGMLASAVPPAMSWAPTDTAGLRDALNTIIGGALSCNVQLAGRIDPTMACTGTVALNGTPLPCDDPNGWRAVDETHIEVLGTACETLMGTRGTTLTASFPCFAIVI